MFLDTRFAKVDKLGENVGFGVFDEPCDYDGILESRHWHICRLINVIHVVGVMK
jgi:hypothetical protein